MANRTESYNLSRSARIVDPNTFPRNAPSVARFQPHDPAPALGYICANVLPTAEGYQSFFGTRRQLGEELLTQYTHSLFTYVSPTGDIFAFALTSQDILTQSVTFTEPEVVTTEPDGFETAVYGIGV